MVWEIYKNVELYYEINNIMSSIVKDQSSIYMIYNDEVIWKNSQIRNQIVREFAFKKTRKQIAGLLINDQLETTICVNKHLSYEFKKFIICYQITQLTFYKKNYEILYKSDMKEMVSNFRYNDKKCEMMLAASIVLLPEKILSDSLQQGWGGNRLVDHFKFPKEILKWYLVFIMQIRLSYSLQEAKKFVKCMFYDFEKKIKIKSIKIGVQLSQLAS